MTGSGSSSRQLLDPAISLALAMYSNKGTFSLLLGSGISKSAGIPTGWDVMGDLIQKVAALKKADCGRDPYKWYSDTFGEIPGYSSLLEQLCPAPSDRAQLLRPYFEPSDKDRGSGLKRPTAAHRAIARLMKDGRLRVVVTTNFDRLLEQALADEGVTPTIISTPDAVKGALPLIHLQHVIIKVNGDYLDLRAKNTIEELSEYDGDVATLLDRIFDEFGLIICGWSGEWDIGLRKAIERCKTRRFSTYWCHRGPPSSETDRLMTLRGAHPISVESADAFFSDLEEKIQAIETVSRPHPLSAPLAVAMVKKFVADSRYDIELHDLVMDESRKVAKMADAYAPAADVPLIDSLTRYEADVEILRSELMYGCYWGKPQHDGFWCKALETASFPSAEANLEVPMNLRLYPSVVLLYSGGLAAYVAGKLPLLRKLLLETKIPESRGGREAIRVLNYLLRDIGNKLPGREKKFTPFSDHLHALLREPFQDFLPVDWDYDVWFDRFEYLLALVFQSLMGYPSNGRFGWRRGEKEPWILGQLEREVASGQSKEKLLAAGFFNNDSSELVKTMGLVRKEYDENLRWHR